MNKYSYSIRVLNEAEHEKKTQQQRAKMIVESILRNAKCISEYGVTINNT